MKKIFLDTNVLLELANIHKPDFRKNFSDLVKSVAPGTKEYWISDLVFNETHAGLTKVGIYQAHQFLTKLILGDGKKFSPCQISYHKQSNHSAAFELTVNPSYIEAKKGLSMVDALLLLQMNDEDGLIFTKDQRMSYYSNSLGKTVAYWVDF